MDCDIIAIPKINIKNDVQLIKSLNDIFNYKADDTYDKSYIFFEESYYCENINIDDFSVIKKTSEICGDDLLVKLHPRNEQDRFHKLGICTNSVTTIPWEIIALNTNIGEKNVITISSAAALASYLIADIRAENIYILSKCEELRYENFSIANEIILKISEKNPGLIQFPDSLDEFYTQLNQRTSRSDKI